MLNAFKKKWSKLLRTTNAFKLFKNLLKTKNDLLNKLENYRLLQCVSVSLGFFMKHNSVYK